MKTKEQQAAEEQDELVDMWDVEVQEDEDDVDDSLELEDQEEEEVDTEDSDTDEDLEENEEDHQEDNEDTDSDEEDEDIDEEDLPVVESIQRTLGYEFDEEFEDTEEGIAKMFEKAKNMAADEALDSMLDAYPEAKEFIEYRQLGGDPDQYFKTKFPQVDYSEVEFNEEDESQHEMIVRKELSERGLSNEEIEADIQDFKNGGILESKAKRALTALQTKQKEEQENLLKRQEEQYQKQQEEIEQYWNDVKSTIESSTSFKAFNVPSKEKEEFFRYISKPVEDGKSQRDLDVEKADRETRLAIDFLLYKDFNIADIVDRKAKSQNAQKLRERMNRRKLDKQQRQNSGSDYTEELGTI